MRYGYESGVNWCVLTNGERYEVYDAFAKVVREKKLVVSFSVTEAAAKPEEELPKLRLLSYEAVTGDELARFAREAFAHERVRELLEDPPAAILAALHAQLKACGMTQEDVRVGLGAVVGREPVPPLPGEGEASGVEGETVWGLRAYRLPVLVRDDILSITRVGAHTRKSHTQQVPLADLRIVSELMTRAPDAGINCADLCRASDGVLNYDRTVNAMGVLYAVGLIESVKGRSVEMRLREPLTADQMVEMVLQKAKPARGETEGRTPGSGEIKVGIRTYHGPVRREGDRLLLQRARPRKGVSEERRVMLADLREVAGAIVRVHERDEAINVVSVTKATDNKVKYWRVKDCLGAVHVAGLLRHSRAQDHTLAEPLTPDQIVERVLSTAQPEQ